MSRAQPGGTPQSQRWRTALLLGLPLALALGWMAAFHDKAPPRVVRSNVAGDEHPTEHSEADERASNEATGRVARTEARQARARLEQAPAATAAAGAPPIAVSASSTLGPGTVGADQPEALLRGELELPWRLPRQCKSETPEEGAIRMLYLSRFVATPVWQSVVYAHAEAPAEAIAVVTRDLEETHHDAVEELGLSARPAQVYVHPSVESMSNHSCAKADALAYYDGAIHLAPPPRDERPHTEAGFERELRTSLKHEYVHHVLIDNGIGRPIWLQEALAMNFAGEVAFETEWRTRPLPLADMVHLLPSLRPEVERRFYLQAATMLFVLQRLCTGLKNCERRQMTEALKQGRTTPEALFEWTIEQRAKELLRTTPEALWLDYVARDSFSPEMLDALLARERAQQ